MTLPALDLRAHCLAVPAVALEITTVDTMKMLESVAKVTLEIWYIMLQLLTNLSLSLSSPS